MSIDTPFLIQRIRDLSAPLEPIPTTVAPHLIPLQGVKAVLFDVYGTLFISGSGDIGVASEMRNQCALQAALAAAGFSGDLEQAGEHGSLALLQTIQQAHETRREQGITYPEVDIREEWRRVLTFLRQDGLIDGTISPKSVLQVSVEYEFRVNPVWPMPEIQGTLSGLREKQIVLGIVSNAQFYTLSLFPALLGQSHTELGFTPHLCAWSFELLEAKPSLNLFRGVLAQLQQTYGITPEETVYVGNDQLNDIWTAAQWGLKTALFAGDQRSLRLREHEPRCRNLKPDVILTSLSLLLLIIPAE